MLLRFLKTYSLVALWALGSQIEAQVAVGRNITSHNGVLLHLKQKYFTILSHTTPTQGLRMPFAKSSRLYEDKYMMPCCERHTSMPIGSINLNETNQLSIASSQISEPQWYRCMKYGAKNIIKLV